MKREFSIRLSLVVVVTLLVLYWITLLPQNPLPAYGKQTFHYLVVDERILSTQRDYRKSPSQNLQRILNQYGSKGWLLISQFGPDNSLIFIAK